MALDITHKVKALNWFHSIDLGDGLVTQGVKSLETLKSEQQTIFDPILLSGASVLDVGAWNGAHSFEAARRGAKVLATDHFVWVHEGWRGREGFDIANIALDLNVEARLLDVPDITVQNVGKHDVVLFLGVLYHLPAPLPLLQSVASVATDCMIVETHADFMNLQEPVLRFHPGDSLNGDASNYFSPNLSFVVQALREVGFTTLSTLGSLFTLGDQFRAVALAALLNVILQSFKLRLEEPIK